MAPQWLQNPEAEDKPLKGSFDDPDLAEQPRDPREGLKSHEQIAMEGRAASLQRDIWRLGDRIRIKTIIEFIIFVGLYIFMYAILTTLHNNHKTGLDNHTLLCNIAASRDVHTSDIDRICNFK